MPYFNTGSHNLLLLHIPKTGGTSLETYFSKKFNIPLGTSSLYGTLPHHLRNKLSLRAVSMQHLVLRTIRRHPRFFRVTLANLQIITIVRNPYNRMMSDLFYFRLVHKDSTQDEVYRAMLRFIRHPNQFDNHTLPQWQFLVDENNRIPNNIKILHTETLTSEMHQLGHTDFDLLLNASTKTQKDYLHYLNAKSIILINSLFKRDFELFGYNKIHR
jgi:hypothetical protein